MLFTDMVSLGLLTVFLSLRPAFFILSRKGVENNDIFSVKPGANWSGVFRNGLVFIGEYIKMMCA